MPASNDLMAEVFGGRARAAAWDLDTWSEALAQARVTLLGARLADHLDDAGQMAAVPERARQYLRHHQFLAFRQAEEFRWEVARIQKALSGLDSPVVLLKGTAYLMAGLPPSRGRLFSDIDLLVRRASLPRLESAMMSAGWIVGSRDAYDQRYYREWMHELPPMTHVRRHTTVDAHHTITPPTSAYAVDGEALLAHIRPIPGHAGLWMLQPVDMVMHSAVHLFGDGEFDHGLRDLIDMDRLIRHFERVESDFWPTLLKRARALGLGEPLYHALSQIERLFGDRIPEGQRAQVLALAPAAWRRALLEPMMSLALRPHLPSCRVPGEAAARLALFVRAHALRMPLRLLVPHLTRKAWMRFFPEKPERPAAP